MIFALLLGILGIGFVIAFHECGHFLFGKLFGVRIPNFSIGFGPQIIKKKIGSTTFSISLIPIGGYVEAESGTYGDTAPGTIAALPYWKKMVIIIGGIAFNLIFAYAVFVGLATTGMPGNPFFSESPRHFIQKVLPNSAADKAGLQDNDKIISINGKDVTENLRHLVETLRTSANKPVTLIIERSGQQKTIAATPDLKTIKGQEIGMLNAQFSFEATPGVPFKQALKKGFKITKTLINNVFNGFKQAAVKRSTEGFAGPLMMIKMCVQMAGQNMALFLFLLAFISINLAILNMIPLPILDGGQALTYTIEALLRRPLKEQTLEYIHYASWLLMVALFLYLTFKDVIAMWFG